jgi:hypothetical protein
MEGEEGEEALGVGAVAVDGVLDVYAGAEEMEEVGEVEEEGDGVGAVAVDGVLDVTAGAAEEEGEDTLSVGAVAVDGVLDVTAGAEEEEGGRITGCRSRCSRWCAVRGGRGGGGNGRRRNNRRGCRRCDCGSCSHRCASGSSLTST